MPLKFILIRHAEATHNVAFNESNKDPSVFYKQEHKDAKLTEKGKTQANNLAKELAEKFPSISAIWSSSLQRSIQTADEIFEETNATEYYIHDNLIERQTPGYYFNYRTEKSKLKEQYGHINMEFIPELSALWTIQENEYALRSRMYMIIMLLLDLYKNINKTIIIVGHADAIYTLTGKNLKNAEYIEMTEEEIRQL